MFKKFLMISILIMGFVIIDNVSAECVTGNGMSYYDIKFVTNGGNELENMELCALCGDFLVAQLPTPTKDDYIFLGWYADENLTIPINSVADDWDQTVVQVEYDNENCPTNKMNVTLYAKWENNNCPQIDGGASTVFQFETNGGDKIDNLSFCNTCADFTEEWNNAKLPIPVKDGYIFAGWYANISLTTEVESIQDENIKFEQKLDENECSDGSRYTTLYAKWENNNCPQIDGGTGTVFLFETNGGDKIDNISICDTCRDAIDAWENTSLPTPIRDGYKFEGWYADKDLSTKVESIQDANIKFEDIIYENGCSYGSRYTTLYAKWEEITNVKVDNTGKNISLFFMIISVIMIISGIIMYIINIKKNEKN